MPYWIEKELDILHQFSHERIIWELNNLILLGTGWATADILQPLF